MRPASRMPRRLPIVRKATSAIEMATRAGCRSGNALVTAATPAATDLPAAARLFRLGGRETPSDEDAVDRRPRAPDPAPAFEGALGRDKARRGMSELGRSDDADVTVARPSTLELFTPVEAAQLR